MTETRACDGSIGSLAATDDDDDGGGGIALTDAIVAIGEKKFFILRLTIIAAAFGGILGFVLPSVYVGQTVIMPPEPARSGIAALAGLSELAGITGAIGVKTPGEMYVGLLESDAVANDLIDRFKLKKRYGVDFMSGARTTLQKKVQVIADKKSGFITVRASDKSPEFAATLANAYIEELRKVLDRIAVTDAQQRRVFFQQQIDKTLARLNEAQRSFDQAQRKSGVVSLDEQVISSIRASADLKAKIVAVEIQLQSMRTYATDENPQIQRVMAEIQAMREQLNTLEQGSDDTTSGTQSGDSVALANIRAYREIKYQEALLDQFRKQFELAQVDEAKEGPLVQQVDIAVPPDRRSAPRRLLIVLISAAAGLMIGSCITLARAWLRTDTELASQLERIKRAWRLRKI